MMMGHSFRISPSALVMTGLLMISLLTTTGCEGPYSSIAQQQTAPKPALLAPGDRLRLIVFGQAQLSGDFLIADDGDMSIPLVGRVPLSGLTAAQAERKLRQRLANGIIADPQVSVDVLRYRPIYVIGEVTRPGSYEPAGRLSVISAIALAGGFTYRARPDRITLMRDNDPSRNQIPATIDTPVGPGDVIIVPERWF